jgi:hypothetical protein
VAIRHNSEARRTRQLILEIIESPVTERIEKNVNFKLLRNYPFRTRAVSKLSRKMFAVEARLTLQQRFGKLIKRLGN